MWHVELEEALAIYLREIIQGSDAFALSQGEQDLWSVQLDDPDSPCADPDPLPVPDYVPVYRGHSRQLIVAPTVIRVWATRPEPPTSDDNLQYEMPVEIVYEQCIYDDDVFLSLMGARCEALELALGVDPQELMDKLAVNLTGLALQGWTPEGMREEPMDVSWRVRIGFLAEVCRTKRGVLI